MTIRTAKNAVVGVLVLAGNLAVGGRADAQQRIGEETVVEGILIDTLSGRPIPFAIIRVAGTDNTTLTNSRGRFTMTVAPGQRQLEFRKIGYRMVSVAVEARGARVQRDVWMSRIPLTLGDISVIAEADNPAHRIIRNAIARKNDVFSRIHDYRYDAYVKLSVHDMDEPADSVESVLVITETQTSAYWEQPDKYQETIVARRQSRNLPADDNLVSVGEIVNFNKNRIDMTKYSVVSPTADDALSHYDYQLVDSMMTAGRKIYRLAIEPRTDAEPLFVGMIDIADSTFDVIEIDVGANEAIRFDFFENLRYQQTLAPVGNDYWLPSEIRFTGEIHFGVPLPGVPQNLSFQHVAALTNFRFDQGNAPKTLGEYLIIVDEGADDTDGASWAERRQLPLTDLEQRAYARIDSVENAPASLSDVLLGSTLGLAFLAFKQYRIGGSYRLSESRRLWFGATARDEIVSRPTVVGSRTNTTNRALFSKSDPLDYYRQEGVSVFLNGRVAKFTTMRLQYNDYRQYTAGVVSDYSFFNGQKVLRDNLPIVDGRLRSVAASVSFDSRKLLKRKGRDFRLFTLPFTVITLGAELASPDLIANDFDFLRYSLRVHREQRTLGLGLTSFDAYAGASRGDLPPQRYFTIDFGNEVFFEQGGFNTMAEMNFAGNRAAYVFLTHDFDQQLFRQSRIPLIRQLPFTLSIHGGAFWSNFVNHRTTRQILVMPVS